MGYFSSDKKKEAKGARCKFTLIKKKYTSTYVKSFYYTVFIFHFKCVSCLKSDSKTDLPCLELFDKKKRKEWTFGFRIRAARVISEHRNY